MSLCSQNNAFYNCKPQYDGFFMPPCRSDSTFSSAGLRDAFSHSVEEAHFRTDQLEQLFYSDLFPAFADTLLSGAPIHTIVYHPYTRWYITVASKIHRSEAHAAFHRFVLSKNPPNASQWLLQTGCPASLYRRSMICFTGSLLRHLLRSCCLHLLRKRHSRVHTLESYMSILHAWNPCDIS